jgi:hypothetical protein
VAINTQKVVVGGLGAGVVMAVLDFVANGVLFREQNTAALNALNPNLAANAEGGAAMAVFIVMDFLFGILLVWTYAAMRPRFGPGPRTALYAGLQLWLVAFLLYFGMMAMGMFTGTYFVIGSLVFLVCMLVASYVGAMLYKEE